MTRERRFGSADLWSGLALALLGGYIITAAWQWEYLGAEGPGPGFFPLWYGIAMLVLSLSLVVSSARTTRAASRARIEWRALGRALSVWLALAVAVAACRLLGFAVSLALLSYFVVAVMYRRPARTAATVAIALGAGFELVFPVALGVALPTGILGF
jgi:putative tricarboxylic transport membrane protein